MSSAALLLFLWIGGNTGAAAPPAPPVRATSKPVLAAATIHPSWTRDPFQPIVPAKPSGPALRPPGRAGLEVGHLRVVAVALGGPTGPVAMVASTAGHTYFLRPGDLIFDAEVIRLESDGVWFERTRPQKGASSLVFRKVS